MAIYRVRIRGHSGIIIDWSWGLHVSSVTGNAAVMAAAAATAFAQYWNGVPAGTNAVKTLYDLATLVDDVVVDELQSDNVHNFQQATTVINLGGTGTGEPLPPNVAVVGSKTSDFPTRRGRGRCYFPPPTVDVMNSGRLTSGARDIFAEGFKNFMTSLSTADGGAYTPVIVHPDFIPSAFTPFNQIKVGDVLDTQRRRRQGLKETYTILNFP